MEQEARQAILRGEDLVRQRCYQRALDVFEPALKLEELDSAKLIALGSVYAAAGHMPQATRILRRAYDIASPAERSFALLNDLIRPYMLQEQQHECNPLIEDFLGGRPGGEERSQFMFFTLPKSAGSSLCSSVAKALNVSKCASGCDIPEMAHYSAGWLHPYLTERLGRFRIIHQTHALPVSRNLALLRHAKEKFVVNVRDPRDAVLSYFHMGNDFRFHRGRFLLANPQYNALEERQQFQFVLESYFDLFVNWIIGWMRLAEQAPNRIMVTTFDQVATNGEALVESVTEFLTSERRGVTEIAKVHFRQGGTREDDPLLTADLRMDLFERIPTELTQRFGWLPI